MRKIFGGVERQKAGNNFVERVENIIDVAAAAVAHCDFVDDVATARAAHMRLPVRNLCRAAASRCLAANLVSTALLEYRGNKESLQKPFSQPQSATALHLRPHRSATLCQHRAPQIAGLFAV